MQYLAIICFILCETPKSKLPRGIILSRNKVEKYHDFKREIGRMWGIRKVQVVPVVIGALGSVTKRFDKWIEKLEIQCNFVDMQKTALLGTARILRKVLEM